MAIILLTKFILKEIKMKKLLCLTALSLLATSAFANVPTSNVSKICIMNHTDNHGKVGTVHWIIAQMSWPGTQVNDDHWGERTDYDHLSCIGTYVLKQHETTHVFSVGYGFMGFYFTDCNHAIYHDDATRSPLTAYYESTQVNGHTQCKFLYNASAYKGV